MANLSYTYIFMYNILLILEKKNCIFIFQITENVDYDQKIGFIIRSPTVRDSGVFICEANRNDINETLQFHVIINSELVLLLTQCVVFESRNC